MGDQKDGLRGLTRFSDNEGDIIWPAWRAELKQRVAFEFGKIGNQIIEGEVKESDVDLGEVTEKINALINALIPRTRAQIQTRSEWMEEFVVNSVEGASDEVCSIKKTKLTPQRAALHGAASCALGSLQDTAYGFSILFDPLSILSAAVRAELRSLRCSSSNWATTGTYLRPRRAHWGGHVWRTCWDFSRQF